MYVVAGGGVGGGVGGGGDAGGEPLASRFCFFLFPASELTFDCLLQEITGKASLGLVASPPPNMILLAFGQLGQSSPPGRR